MFLEIAFVLLCATEVLSKNDLSCGKPENPHGDIFSNGIGKIRSTWTWHAYVEGEVQCGGALVTPNHILTAAHCVALASRIRTDAVPVSSLKITFGLHNRSDLTDTQVRKVKKILIHPDFNFETDDADIAILTLSEPVRLSSHVNTVCLPTDKYDTVPDNTTCYATGFGKPDANKKVSEILRQFPAKYTEWHRCEDLLEDLLPGKRLNETMCCAGTSTGGLDICEADSGGPLVCLTEGKWELQGLVGFGDLVDCGRQSDTPGIYTNIPYLYDWIQQNTNI